MKTEKSCGAVVFTKEYGNIKYVIIRSKSGIFGFPKGHRENLETEKETAIREIKEETGLNVNFIKNFKTKETYYFGRCNEKVEKTVVYFLAEYKNQNPKAQESEIDSIYLMDFNEAMKVFQFENTKEVLKEADAFLKK